jgi:hypothetical protein
MAVDDGRPHQARNKTYYKRIGVRDETIEVEGLPDPIANLLRTTTLTKDNVVCKVDNLGSFQCFSRNMKPHIWFCWYPKSGRGWWRVTRNYAIKWKHLTMQEKDNLLAAHEYVKILNQRYEDKNGI